LYKAIRTHDPLFSSSINPGHQDSLIYTHFSHTHPSSISSSIHCGVHLSLYLNIFMWDLVLKNLLKRIQWCNRNLIWVFDLWVITFFRGLKQWGHHHLSPLSPTCSFFSHSCALADARYSPRFSGWQLSRYFSVTHTGHRCSSPHPLYAPAGAYSGLHCEQSKADKYSFFFFLLS
jgi:hypothetical protein